MDAVRYPSDKLAELYYRRWSIELFYRDIKTTMRMVVMRTKTPAMIEKELRMNAKAYNALLALILESASVHQQELGRISFKGAADLLRERLPQAAACHDQPRMLARWHEELLDAIASIQNPLRLLDTMLAATFHGAGVKQIVTNNERDFRVLGAFEIVSFRP